MKSLFERPLLQVMAAPALAMILLGAPIPNDDFVQKSHNGSDPCHTTCKPTWGDCKKPGHKHGRSCQVIQCTGTPVNPGSDYCFWK
jgi:hypothetical protein